VRVARSCGSPCCKLDVRHKIPSTPAPYRLLYRRSVGSAQQRRGPAHLSLHSGGNSKFRKAHRGSHYLLRDEVQKSRALRGRTPLKAGPVCSEAAIGQGVGRSLSPRAEQATRALNGQLSCMFSSRLVHESLQRGQMAFLCDFISMFSCWRGVARSIFGT
jgi:hypothetical protein